MDEGDALSFSADARHIVNEANGGGSAAVESRVEIGDDEAHVMQARTASGDEFSDGRVGLERLEQLDERVAGSETFYARPVRVVERHYRQPEYVAVEGYGVGNGTDGDADVCDADGRVGRRW